MPVHLNKGQMLFGAIDTENVPNALLAAAENQFVVIVLPVFTVDDE
ncbi:MAG: hypothetical protein ACLTZY_01780 [Alistipes indistinctus]